MIAAEKGRIILIKGIRGPWLVEQKLSLMGFKNKSKYQVGWVREAVCPWKGLWKGVEGGYKQNALIKENTVLL